MVLRDLAGADGPVGVHITTPKLVRSLVVAHRRDRYVSSAAQAFARELRELVRGDHASV